MSDDKEIEIEKTMDGEGLAKEDDISLKEDFTDDSDHVIEGAFFASLKRNYRQIKNDRAASISEDAEMDYKIHIQTLERKIKQIRRERDNMLDLSPQDRNDLGTVKNFNSKEFVAKDAQLGLDMRNTKIKLELAKNRYNFLFGGM